MDDKKNIILILCTIALVIGTVYGYSTGIFTDQNKMDTFLSQSGIMAPLLFILIQAVQVVVPILPGAVGCLFGVIFFGTIKGFVFNYIGICIGSILAFLLARNFGQEFVRKMTSKKFFEKYNKYLMKENQFEKIFALLIFLPVAPDDFLCYLAGISRMSLKKFTTIILLGKPAAIMLYSLGLNQVFQATLQMIR
ncbi:MAG: TVP38/TMEM64 family protein [Massilibacteroides sp.]|nr:TVP38/TMEM64 family protein [Massilibacteroides sp.]